MIGTERPLMNRERSPQERLGVGVTTLIDVQRSQAVQRLNYVKVLGTKGFLLDRQEPLLQRYGFRVPSCLVELSELCLQRLNIVCGLGRYLGPWLRGSRQGEPLFRRLLC
jgi:hypothetical protein